MDGQSPKKAKKQRENTLKKVLGEPVVESMERMNFNLDDTDKKFWNPTRQTTILQPFLKVTFWSEKR